MPYKVMVETASGVVGRSGPIYDDGNKWQAEGLAFLLPRNTDARRAWVEEAHEDDDDTILNIKHPA